MYFGDFLIKSKIITPDNLIQALCYQVESMPSLFRIISESRYVAANDILNALKSHIKQDIDIIDILMREKKLTQDQVNELNLKQLSLKVPLGESLIKLQLITNDQLNELLTLYFAEKNSGEQVESKKQETVSDAALESLRELGIDISQFETISSSDLKSNVTESIPKRLEVEYFLNVFSEKQKNKLIKLVDILEISINNETELGNYFNSLYRDMHLLKGAASFSEINIFEPFLAELDLLLDQILSAGEESIKKWCKLYLNNIKLFIHEFWILRSEIESFKSDLGLSESHEGILKCKELVNLMKQASK